MEKRRCTKTLSGIHLFMPLEWMEKKELVVWNAHGVPKVSKCIACGMYNDTGKPGSPPPSKKEGI